ncbi:hypothetical protein SLE2022_062290 [Rubroshorea leprosula]
MSNSVNSLDGEFGIDRTSARSRTKGMVAAVEISMMLGAFVGLSAMLIKWKRRLQDWRKKNSFSSSSLPIHASSCRSLPVAVDPLQQLPIHANGTSFTASKTSVEQNKIWGSSTILLSIATNEYVW